MINSLVFHEAFDSTRTADRQAAPNLAQAQAEALASLLLGHSLALTNTYAFDSRGVLELVKAVLSARDDVKSTLRPGSPARRRLQRAHPFMLTWYGAGSFFDACANQLRNFNPDDDDDRFLLSAWGPIDLKRDLRSDLAGALQSGPDPEPPRWLGEFPGLPEQFDALAAINRYARSYGRGRPASETGAVDLLDYLLHFHELGRQGRLVPLVAEWKCREDVAVRLWERIDKQLHVEDSQNILSRRSWIHVAVRVAKDKPDPDVTVLEQVKELVDTFYNARLAQSGYADSDFLSSVPRSSDTRELRDVNDLAIKVIGHRRPGAAQSPLDGMFTAPTNEPRLDVAPLQKLFQAYWAIIADDDRCRTWQRSCDAVNRLLRDKPALREGEQTQRERTEYSDWTQRFRYAWAVHMGLLRRQLPKVVRTDDNTLQVIVPQGGSVFRNSLRLADGSTPPPTRKEIEDCLATGRYVSNIESWVNV